MVGLRVLVGGEAVDDARRNLGQRGGGVGGDFGVRTQHQIGQDRDELFLRQREKALRDGLDGLAGQLSRLDALNDDGRGEFARSGAAHVRLCVSD